MDIRDLNRDTAALLSEGSGEVALEHLEDRARDLCLHRRWRLRSGRFLFFIDVQNSYNRRNLAGFDLQVDEDTAEFIVEEEQWPGLFPSVGIAWEF
ncbi:MAG: hypothetical protein GY856_09230 [bacterium]|nr:hypothetical protein [bacterium]